MTRTLTAQAIATCDSVMAMARGKHEPDSVARSMAHALERAGWGLQMAEVNTHLGTARVEIRGRNGMVVTLDARNGRASVTRELVALEHVGNRRDRYSERLCSQFLGRSRHEGVRSAMRGLAHYLADNAPAATLTRQHAKRLLSPLLAGSPTNCSDWDEWDGGKHVPEPAEVVTCCAGCLADLRRTVMHHRGGEVVCTTCVRGL